MEDKKEHPEEVKSTSKKTTRRNAIKAGGLFASSAFIPMISSVALAGENQDWFDTTGDDKISKTAHREESYQYNINQDTWYRIESTVNCVGAQLTDSNTWQTRYITSAYGVARRYNPSTETPKGGQKVDILDYQSVGWSDDTNDGTNGTIWYTNDSHKVGGWPNTEYTATEILEDGLEATFKAAMGSLSETANLMLQYTQMYQKIKQGYADNASNTDGESKTFAWDYGGTWMSDQYSDLAHGAEILFEVPADDSVGSFYLESAIENNDLRLSVNWKISSSGPTDADGGGGGCGSAGCIESVESMSAEEKDKYGVKKIPVYAAKQAGFDTDRAKILDGDKILVATRPPVTIEQV